MKRNILPCQIFSPTILDGRPEPQGGADVSQPFRSETNQKSAAAGPGRYPEHTQNRLAGFLPLPSAEGRGEGIRSFPDLVVK